VTHDPLFTYKQAAEQVGMSPRTIRRWCKEKRLRAVRIPGTRLVRIRLSDLVRALQTDALPATPADAENDESTDD
jgi:excisionase family DNA binding protein